MNTRRKKIVISLLFAPVCLTFAASDNWGGYGSNPVEVLDSVVGEANKIDQIQETALDGISSTQGAYGQDFKISNTLEYLRLHIATYLQWIVYISLSLAVILLIYNGFLMVTHVVHKEGDFSKIKKNIMNIFIWVIILTSFYAIIKLVIGILNSIFGVDSTGATGL